MGPERPAAGAAPDEGYLAALDGLRALSILVVLVAHFGLGHIVPGGFGVTVFFFLSGFLISRQLLAGAARHGGVRVGNFYLRRLVRLAPPLLLMIAVCAAMMPLLGAPLRAAEIGAALLYVINYYAVFVGFALTEPYHHPFDVLWSLAVEQHFYLLLPLAVAALSHRPRALLAGALALAAAILAWRYALDALCIGVAQAPAVCGRYPAWRTYLSTDTRLDSILYGVILTLALAGAGRDRVLAFLTAWPVVILAGIGLLACFVIRDPSFRETARYTIQGLCLTPFFAAILFAPGWGLARRLLTVTPMRLLGRWSYSIYLFHWPALVVAEHVIGPRVTPAWLALALGLTALLSLGSHYGVERQVEALRRRLRDAGRRKGPVAGPSAAG